MKSIATQQAVRTYTLMAVELAIEIALEFPERLPATEATAEAEAMVAWFAVLKLPL